MRLFEAIIEANHRAIAGDADAGVRVADYTEELPVIALTCVDPRLNALFPNVLGLPGEQFIWLRNAGNIITSTLSSTMRSLSLACAVKGGKEIAVIGHTDCQVRKTTTMELLEKLKAAGIERHLLPENINEFFGMFGSEQQNVIKACDFIRRSPLIGPKVPVQGLLVHVDSGELEWIVNGYQNWDGNVARWNEAVQSAGHAVDAIKDLGNFQIGEMKFPETKIGESVVKAEDWLAKKINDLQVGEAGPPKIVKTAEAVVEKIAEVTHTHWRQPGPPQPHKIPVPPPIRPRMTMKKK